jgi:hypothetical protein
MPAPHTTRQCSGACSCVGPAERSTSTAGAHACSPCIYHLSTCQGAASWAHRDHSRPSHQLAPQPGQHGSMLHQLVSTCSFSLRRCHDGGGSFRPGSCSCRYSNSSAWWATVTAARFFQTSVCCISTPTPTPTTYSPQVACTTVGQSAARWSGEATGSDTNKPHNRQHSITKLLFVHPDAVVLPHTVPTDTTNRRPKCVSAPESVLDQSHMF